MLGIINLFDLIMCNVYHPLSLWLLPLQATLLKKPMELHNPPSLELEHCEHI